MIGNFLLIFFSVIAILAAFGMLLFKHPMRVALSLVTVMLSLASIFAVLNNHVLAIFQVLIYVGAIMVFMIYVIMLLDPRDQSLMRRFSKYLFGGGVMLVLSLAFLAPKVQLVSNKIEGKTLELTVKEFSLFFIRDYFLYFELTSMLLVIGVVGAVAVIKGRKNALN